MSLCFAGNIYLDTHHNDMGQFDPLCIYFPLFMRMHINVHIDY